MNRIKNTVRAIICLLLLTGFYNAQAATVTAVSGSFLDVSNAIALANYGDTVRIPAGTWLWTNADQYVCGLTLAGMGASNTTILDNVPSDNNGSARMVNMVANTNYLSRITGITFANGGNPSTTYHGKVEANASEGGTFRIDHCVFTNLNSENIFVHGNAGLVDHCTFYLQSAAVTQYGIKIDPNNPYGSSSDTYGDFSWATPPAYGTTNELYIENCFMTNIIPGSSSSPANDAYAGARSVFRYNTVWNTFWANHGNDTSQRYRGTRSMEIYENTFIDDQSFYAAMDFRSGTGVVFSNTLSGYGGFAALENYRNVQGNTFGGITGFNSWDSNDPTLFASGFHSGASGTVFLQVTNTWMVNQWAGYVVNNTNTGRFCMIQGNTANQLILTHPKDLPAMTFNTGDGYTIYLCTAALDQVGRGSGDLLADVNIGNWPNSVTYTYNTAYGTNYATQQLWPRQILEPLYSWGNTLNGNASGVTSGSGYANIVEGRDIYFNAIKPNYTPLPYPHPLDVADTSADSNSQTNSSSTNSATSTLSPPSALSVVPQ